jgi:2-phospho-L-lactate transferase/gluconeogenesis factor (CofD/UPF0052 family)
MNIKLNPDQVEISLFCGGRGSANLIKELVKNSNIKLNLIINGYDNGLSTGVLRKFIPGMLGPSDFRKNLSHLLEIHSPNQHLVIELLEYRFPNTMSNDQIIECMLDFNNLKNLDGLINIFNDLEHDYVELVKKYIVVFGKYCQEKNFDISFDGCSLGNLVFAGVFLDKGHDFNGTLEQIMSVFQSKLNASLCNVSRGENRYLVGLKENGDFLYDESLMVEKQDHSCMAGIYLLEKEPDQALIDGIANLNFIEKKKKLELLHSPPEISKKAKEVIGRSDVIIYGCGTQYSSTFPSYLTVGVKEAVQSSKAKVKAYVSNIKYDEDIYTYDLEKVVNELLLSLSDSNNKGSLSHVYYNIGSEYLDDGIKQGALKAETSFKNAKLIKGDFQHPIYPSKHCGSSTISSLMKSLYQSSKIKNKETDLELFVSLHNRSIGIPYLIDEFLDIKWLNYFKSIVLYIDGDFDFCDKLPDGIKIMKCDVGGDFPELNFFQEWLGNPERSDFLLTLSGDGDYRLKDFLKAYDILNSSNTGAIFGTRVQSRHQFMQALSSAYTENKLLFKLSQMGAFVLSFLFSIRSGLLFTDPITGFRAYSRYHIRKRIIDPRELDKFVDTPSSLALKLLGEGIDIGEIPVTYRTYSGFTDPNWRIRRAIRNLVSLINIFGRK